MHIDIWTLTDRTLVILLDEMAIKLFDSSMIGGMKVEELDETMMALDQHVETSAKYGKRVFPQYTMEQLIEAADIVADNLHDWAVKLDQIQEEPAPK